MGLVLTVSSSHTLPGVWDITSLHPEVLSGWPLLLGRYDLADPKGRSFFENLAKKQRHQAEMKTKGWRGDWCLVAVISSLKMFGMVLVFSLIFRHLHCTGQDSLRKIGRNGNQLTEEAMEQVRATRDSFGSWEAVEDLCNGRVFLGFPGVFSGFPENESWRVAWQKDRRSLTGLQLVAFAEVSQGCLNDQSWSGPNVFRVVGFP